MGKTCKKGFELKVYQSAAGFYIGTKTADGQPNCRLTDYAETFEEASNLPLIRQTWCIENEHCNGGNGCFYEG